MNLYIWVLLNAWKDSGWGRGGGGGGTDVILFPFKVEVNSERLCVSKMEMEKLSTECLSKGLSSWILIDSSLLSGFINCKRKIIL